MKRYWRREAETFAPDGPKIKNSQSVADQLIDQQ